jgi:hypothetical protein
MNILQEIRTKLPRVIAEPPIKNRDVPPRVSHLEQGFVSPKVDAAHSVLPEVATAQFVSPEPASGR